MYKFNIEIPKEVICANEHNTIDFKALEGKVVVGLTGYAKSGKDSIAKIFIEDYGYQRVAFADNIKKEMNLYLKQLVCKDINEREKKDIEKPIESGEELIDYWPLTASKIDFFTENLELKKILRPYIIWYGEKLRNINGVFCWVNKAFAEDGKNMDKIVLSDVRRLAELDIFKNSNEFKKRFKISMAEAGSLINQSVDTNNYGTLLLEVSQFGLTDADTLTIETIQKAHEQWLIDDTFWVDARVPDNAVCRQKALKFQIKRIVKKFGIEKIEKTKHFQPSLFQKTNTVD